ncbi:hypothetical protein [Blastococcus sp. CT_GayMR16]|uniref:hypothetical protein n=1 Tax=Blastococcus sp. CT_GayMR16 TaxID=2559607 RepID=UPI0010737EA2|nr:hypothetical protein [Blastococcus sp. CT_GayMR16]TFV89494.1 hypothetical protein E4P38_06875 [Blastococcus sp. CT_GayMR16]
MTAPTKNNASTPKPTDDNERSTAATGSAPTRAQASLVELARSQEELTQEIRRLVARRAIDEGTDDGDDRERAGRTLTVARAELVQQLREQEQEEARRELVQATRSSEDAAAGVVRSVTTIVRTIVPTALVRPEDLIEAAYTLADQALRVSRRVALTVSSSVRSLTAAV